MNILRKRATIAGLGVTLSIMIAGSAAAYTYGPFSFTKDFVPGGGGYNPLPQTVGYSSTSPQVTVSLSAKTNVAYNFSLFYNNGSQVGGWNAVSPGTKGTWDVSGGYPGGTSTTYVIQAGTSLFQGQGYVTGSANY
ncbi:MAG: hypothetical protein OWR52_13995 [Acidibacillus sp.]|nr:hypothetical protein [Acidibacillus sp.]